MLRFATLCYVTATFCYVLLCFCYVLRWKHTVSIAELPSHRWRDSHPDVGGQVLHCGSSQGEGRGPGRAMTATAKPTEKQQQKPAAPCKTREETTTQNVRPSKTHGKITKKKRTTQQNMRENKQKHKDKHDQKHGQKHDIQKQKLIQKQKRHTEAEANTEADADTDTAPSSVKNLHCMSIMTQATVI